MGCATPRHECAVDCSTFIPSIHVVMNIFLFAKGREGYTLWGLCATTPSKVASTTKHPGPPYGVGGVLRCAIPWGNLLLLEGALNFVPAFC